MISEEVWKGVNDCIKVMKKLDAGESITPGSSEHQALIWGVLRLIDDHLLDHRPLTPEELAHAQQIVERYRQGDPNLQPVPKKDPPVS